MTGVHNYNYCGFTIKEKELTTLLKNSKAPRKEGPFVQNLDKTLASFHVCRQAYYSGTFVGNHVHTALKVHYLILMIIRQLEIIHPSPQEKNVSALCDSVSKLATERCPELLPSAMFVCTTFTKVFNLFGLCHSMYDTSKPLSDTDISKLGKYKAHYTQY